MPNPSPVHGTSPAPSRPARPGSSATRVSSQHVRREVSDRPGHTVASVEVEAAGAASVEAEAAGAAGAAGAAAPGAGGGGGGGGGGAAGVVAAGAEVPAGRMTP